MEDRIALSRRQLIRGGAINCEELAAGMAKQWQGVAGACLVPQTQAEKQKLAGIWLLKLIDPVDGVYPSPRRASTLDLDGEPLALEVMPRPVRTAPRLHRPQWTHRGYQPVRQKPKL